MGILEKLEKDINEHNNAQKVAISLNLKLDVLEIIDKACKLYKLTRGDFVKMLLEDKEKTISKMIKDAEADAQIERKRILVKTEYIPGESIIEDIVKSKSIGATEIITELLEKANLTKEVTSRVDNKDNQDVASSNNVASVNSDSNSEYNHKNS